MGSPSLLVARRGGAVRCSGAATPPGAAGTRGGTARARQIGRKRNHHMLSEHLNHLLLLANLYWTQAPPVADPPVMPPLCLDHSVLDATTESARWGKG
ncbi:uncharacterized protein LOC144297027 isoform X3 [Canis aureus]